MKLKGIGVRSLVAGGLVAAVLFGPGMRLSAFAQTGVCRTDPTVTLSNTDILDLSSVINDTSTDVMSVTYTLHGPVGTFPLLTVKTGWATEYFKYVADQPAGKYYTVTTISTGTRGVTFSATSALVSLLGITLQSGSGAGSTASPSYVYLKSNPLLGL
jgi:hypothetical protein